jgi:hypothetical protein
MKLKKTAAAILALAFVLSLAVLPASANTGTLTFSPGTGTPRYEIRVTGTATVARQNYISGDIINLDSAFLPASYTTGHPLIRHNTSGATFNVAQVKDASLTLADGSATTTATLTAGNSAVTFGIQSGSNRLSSGNRDRVTWTATLVLTDDTRHPINDLNFTASGFSFRKSGSVIPEIDIPDKGASDRAAITFEEWSMNVINVTSTQSLPKNQNLSSGTFLGNGTRMSISQCVALRDAARFDVVVNLSRAIGSTTPEVFTLTTSLNTTGISQVVMGASSVTFSNVPKSYFFDVDAHRIWGSTEWESTFHWLRIANNTADLNITSIVLTYSGSAPGTQPPTTTPGEDPAVDDLQLNFNALTLNVGSSTAVIRAPGYAARDLRFSVASPGTNNDIITIYSSGRVEARRTGRVTVNVRNAANELATCVVTVVARPSRPITNFRFSSTGGTIYRGGTYNLLSGTNVTITPNNNDIINWSSSDRSIATVDNGRVRVVGTGRVTITAITGSGITQVRVLNARPPEILMSVTSATINAGQTHTIAASARPSSGNNGRLTYSSSNQSIATVSSTGVITGVASGNTRIQITSGAGVVREFTITVR